MNNRTERKPENFDWVKARSVCSLGAMFDKLKMQVKTDVEARKALLPEHNFYSFSFLPGDVDWFAVRVEGASAQDSLRFELRDDNISASNREAAIFTATVTLCDDGECRFKIGAQEYDSWQIRKMALEDFFFKKR
jgi:hypothetical protein